MASTVSGETLSGLLQNPLSCWWKIPGKDIVVLLRLKVLDRINKDLRDASRGAARNGEIHGLLLGNITFNPDLRVTVTESRPLFCEYDPSSVGRLSDETKASFRKQIDRCKSSMGRFSCILSYYRSNNRQNFEPGEDDLAIARELIPDIFFYLLIQPSRPTNIGGLFFYSKTDNQPECNLLFPFSKDRLLSGQTTFSPSPWHGKDAFPDMVSSLPPLEPSQHEVQTFPKPSRFGPSQPPLPFGPPMVPSPHTELVPERLGISWLWICLAVCLILGIGGILYKYRWPGIFSALQSKSSEPSDLALEAGLKGNWVHIKWNSAAPSVLSAREGLLSIWNGLYADTHALNRQDLRRGSIELPRTGDRIAVQLRLFSENKNTIELADAEGTALSEFPPISEPEMTRTVSGETADKTAPPAGIDLPPKRKSTARLSGSAGKPPSIRGASTVPFGTSARAPSSLQQGLRSSNGATGSSNDRNKAAASGLPARPLPEEARSSYPKAEAARSTGSTNKNQNLIPSPESFVTDNRTAQQSPAASSDGTVQPVPSKRPAAISTPPPSSSTVQIAKSTEAGSGNGVPDAKSGSVSSVSRSADSGPPADTQRNSAPSNSFVAPRPMDAIKPIVVPPNLRSRVRDSMEVSVRIYVDAAGAVIGAKSSTSDAQISALAVDAVRKMRFSPARRGTRNVAGELVVNLELVKNSPK